MNKNRASRRALALLAIVALSMFVLACGRSTEFTITLKPPRVLQIIQTALDIAQVDVPIEISGIEIHEGYIHAGGSYTDESGKTTSGIVDLALSTQDGELKAEIVGADISGVDLTAEQIAGFNELLSKEFNQAATSVPGVQIVSVETVEGAVKVRVKLGLGN